MKKENMKTRMKLKIAFVNVDNNHAQLEINHLILVAKNLEISHALFFTESRISLISRWYSKKVI